jgi:hypothetical protein
MSSFDLINFMMISDVDRGSKNMEHLNDQRDRANFIAKKTGYEPVSWYEFKQSMPREEPKTVANMVLGSTIGLAVGLAIGIAFPPILFPLAISAAMIGGAAGAFTDTENTRRNKLVEKYKDYLDGFEALAGKEQAMTQGIDYKTTHTKELLADRQLAKPIISI